MTTAGNASKQSMTTNIGSSTDTLGADHEYHEISDEENQDSPLRFDKALNFDFGPSLLAEMDQMFRSLGKPRVKNFYILCIVSHVQDNIYDSFLYVFFIGSSPPPPPPGHPLPTEHESSNARNELREIQAKQCSKKKQATVSPINVQ